MAVDGNPNGIGAASSQALGSTLFTAGSLILPLVGEEMLAMRASSLTRSELALGRVRAQPFDEAIRGAMNIPREAGFSDIVAHGNTKMMNLGEVVIDHRAYARIIKNLSSYSGENLRLLACDTGRLPRGFAQGLADRLGVTVRAPSSKIWVDPMGNYHIGPTSEIASGGWIDFVPKGGK